jgi:hypothetical protein
MSTNPRHDMHLCLVMERLLGVVEKPCVALSTMEAEYIACLVAVQEVVLLRRFLQHLNVVTTINDHVTFHCDSIATLAYAKDPKYHERTKHIHNRFHYIRDMVTK